MFPTDQACFIKSFGIIQNVLASSEIRAKNHWFLEKGGSFISVELAHESRLVLSVKMLQVL